MSDKYNPYNQLGPIIQQEKKTKNWWLQPKLSHTHTSWDNHLVNQFFSRACSHTVLFIIFFYFFFTWSKSVGEIITLSTSSSPKLFLTQIQPHDYYVLITYCYILQRNKHWINSFQICYTSMHWKICYTFEKPKKQIYYYFKAWSLYNHWHHYCQTIRKSNCCKRPGADPHMWQPYYR